ncbi:hypothetical protein [Sphingobacterium sp.]|uniref:hypothetical protein n=1 Tax=Sphingobacterium sp. TaxID=341027 RepID=UPI0028995745|nr:hypothetical protein [Sphingobacterium sp.]
MANLIKIDKYRNCFRILFFSIVFLSCNNDRKTASVNAEDTLYLQIVFEDFFQNDLLDLSINDEIILEKDTLNSGFSDGITSTIIRIFRQGEEYEITVHDKAIFIPIKDSLITIFIILNNKEFKFQINPEDGVYIGLNKKKDGSLRIAQSKTEPLYD